LNDSCAGTTSVCNPCPTLVGPHATCNTTSGQCECTPVKCCKDTGGIEPCIQPGVYGPSLSYPDHNDGCGGSGSCSS
jgi:hypothetical protein